MADVKFFYGPTTPSNATQLDEGKLFFNTTTHIVYRCDAVSGGTYAWNIYGGKVQIGIPASFAASEQGVLYIDSTSGAAKINAGGSDYVIVSSGSFDYTVDNTVESKQTDTSVPSTKAVYTYVEGKFGNSSGQAPVIDSITGKLPSSVLPSVALSDFVGTYTSISALITDISNGNKSAEIGDYALISNNPAGSDDGTYVLTNTPATTASNWLRIITQDTNTWRPVKYYDGTTETVVVNDYASDFVIKQGSNITLSKDSNNRLIIAATDTTYSVATTSADGLMSSTDKAKLDGLSTLEWQTISNN